MYRLTYFVDKDQADNELEWLRDQKIFPSLQDAWDWKRECAMTRFGVIVDEGALLTIKLRTNRVESVEGYRQKK